MSARPRSSSPLQDRAFRSSRGFALLVTITLLAFLVVLLVGLASYTRIETAVAGNTQRQEQARQNALLGLNVALAQLQKAAGPDRRVTATGEAVGAKTKFYTGVWDATTTGAEPMTWLVSGSEVSNATPDSLSAAALDPTTDASADEVFLVGDKSVSKASERIKLPKRDIPSFGVPGRTGEVRVGRYAWWVGDQGVKAPVAVPDTSATVNYAPFGDSTAQNELGKRLRQQLTLGAGAADATGTPVFEPQDKNNATLVANDKIMASGQLAFLKTPANAAVGLKPVQDHFHAWSPNNFAVLANPKTGGLRQDLSLKPDLLGPAFTAWADYKSYMEDPAAPAAPAPLQPYAGDPLRRRYVMQPASSDYPISPVLTFFGLSVSIHNDTTNNSPNSLNADIRCVVGLWNPYSSALVPEDLEVVIDGLPTVAVASPGAPPRVISLQTVFETAAGPGVVNFSLPFTANSQDPDRSSWLPGRVYNWSVAPSTGVPGSGGYPMQFYVRDAVPSGVQKGFSRDAGSPIGPNTISGVQQHRAVAVSAKQILTVKLRRASDRATLAVFRSLEFDPFSTVGSTRSPGDTSGDFAYVFRLPDVAEFPTGETSLWLQAAGRDVRESIFPDANHDGYIVVGGQQPDPSLLVSATSFFTVSFPDLLLDRAAGARSYNEDVPVFELPRAPLLSLGQLQHLRISGARPFAIGNPWGAGVQINGIAAAEVFDRFYLSGLVAGVEPTTGNGSLVLPAPQLRVLRDSSTGDAPTVADLQGAPNAYSAKYLLQGGAFNVNSTEPLAWAAVFRAVRFGTGADFSYLDAVADTGTTDDTATVTAGISGAAFFRFPHSAQEVYKAESDYPQSVFGGNGPVIDTPLFRRGVRTLDGGQIVALAAAIVANIKSKHADSGAFRSLEEFLNPLTVLNDQSVIEKAIADAGINAAIPEFSSQFLTQGDIMTALAPVLFPRSDTFVIRAYGEAVNPATNATEGRAWCEATVQRVPEYFDSAADAADVAPADLTSELNKTYGRRFKIVSFRWLTRSDI